MQESTVVHKVRNTIRKYKLLAKGDRVLLGVSGGPDSLCLLYTLLDLKKEFRLDLHIAHVDHGLRCDSGNDRKFVQRLGAKFNVPVSYKKINLAKLAAGVSLEEAARNARLEFFFQTARIIQADKIALGHTQDDQAETVLMRIVRGSGLYGLSAIAPKRNIRGFVIIRPLIDLSRREVEVELRKERIKPRIDSSNAQDIYFRNKIRNSLLPLLEKTYNKNIREVLAHTAESVGLDYDFLRAHALKVFARLKGKLVLEKIKDIHPALRRLLIREAILRCKGNTRTITFVHLREIEDLIFHRPINSVVNLPKGISVIKRAKYLAFRRNPDTH